MLIRRIQCPCVLPEQVTTAEKTCADAANTNIPIRSAAVLDERSARGGAIPDPLDEIERTLLAYAAKATEFAELDPERNEWFCARQAAFMDSIAVVQSVRRAHKLVIRRSQEAPPGTVF